MDYLTVEPNHPIRAVVEEHVRRVYRTAYGATIGLFPRQLAVALDDFGEPLCAAGMRPAGSGFFSEAYLDEPIEAAVFRLTGRRISRASFVEVSTLASSNSGVAMGLFDYITRTSNANGQTWAFFTATKSLCRCFRRVGAPLIEVGSALPGRIPDAALWGRYYLTDPQVCVFENSPAAPVRFPRCRQPSIPPAPIAKLAVAQYA